MAIMKIEYHSEVLDMSRQVNVLYPDRNQVENPDDGERVRAMRLLSDAIGVMAEMYNALSQYAETGPRKTPTQIVAAQNERGDYVALKYKEL